MDLEFLLTSAVGPLLPADLEECQWCCRRGPVGDESRWRRCYKISNRTENGMSRMWRTACQERREQHVRNVEDGMSGMYKLCQHSGATAEDSPVSNPSEESIRETADLSPSPMI